MPDPTVTILILAYNYGAFVEEAIDSVLAQDFPADRMEVLVVDDGSTDDTAERVKKHGSRVQYFYKSNGGQASAFNFGFAKAQGDIIALLDADDYWLPGKLGRIVAEFEKNPELGMVYHPYLEVDSQTGETRVSRFPLVSGSFMEGKKEFFWYQAPGTAAAYRRSVLEKTLPIPQEIRMLADGYFGGVIPLLSPVLAVPEPLAAYRFHGKNSFHAEDRDMPQETRRSRLDMWRILVQAKCKWLAEHGYDEKERAVREMTDRWRLYQQGEEFKLEAPGRLQFFRHLMLYARCYGPHISPRLRFISYLNAAGALLTGYQHFPVLEELREKTASALRWLRSAEPSR